MRDTRTSKGNMRDLQNAIVNLTSAVKKEKLRLATCCKQKKCRLSKDKNSCPIVEVENGVGLRRSTYWVTENDERAGTAIVIVIVIVIVTVIVIV